MYTTEQKAEDLSQMKLAFSNKETPESTKSIIRYLLNLSKFTSLLSEKIMKEEKK